MPGSNDEYVRFAIDVQEKRQPFDRYHLITRRLAMNIVAITNAKLSVVFREGALPVVDPSSPQFMLDLEGVKIAVRVNAKSARKLAVHPGGAVLQGKLAVQGGNLTLLDAGFNWLDPKPVEVVTTPPNGQTTQESTS